MHNKIKLRKKYIYPNSWISNNLRHEYFSIKTIKNIPADLPFLIRPRYNNEPTVAFQRAGSNYLYTCSYAALFSNIYLDFYFNAFIIFPDPKSMCIQQHYTSLYFNSFTYLTFNN